MISLLTKANAETLEVYFYLTFDTRMITKVIQTTRRDENDVRRRQSDD